MVKSDLPRSRLRLRARDLGTRLGNNLKTVECTCVFLNLSNLQCHRSHGVMVSTLDSESSDPSSNLGGTLEDDFFFQLKIF